MASDDLVIGPAGMEHLAGITEIYNDAILNTTATFDSCPRTMEEQEEWMGHHDERHPVLVAIRDGDIVGWGSLSSHNDRCCYQNTVEDSVYVRKDLRGVGIGTKILEALVTVAKQSGYHAIIARIDAGNEASLGIHGRAGFEEVGRLREVGFKFGRWLDVIFMELLV
jgi:phosphinothricin acetyltransferase